MRLVFVAIFFLALGMALLMLTEKCKREPAPRTEPKRTMLALPIMQADATVQQCTTIYKCGNERRYYSGMRK